MHKQLEFKLRNDIDTFNDEIETYSIAIIDIKSKNLNVTAIYRAPKEDVNVLKRYSFSKKINWN